MESGAQQQAAGMNAGCEAYAFLEARYTGGYSQLVQDVLNAEGVLIQEPRAFIAAVVQGEVAHVIFACGDLPRVMRHAVALAPVFGFSRVRWERELCGKRKGCKVYTIEQLKRYGR